MFDIPWAHRFLFLIVLMALVASVDYFNNSRDLWKSREYLFLLLASGLVATFGALNDQLSCSLSPEYFQFGKGLGLGSGFRWRVAGLGAKAGFMGGFLVFGLFLIFAKSNRLQPIAFYTNLIRLLRYPFVYSVLFSLILGPTFAYLPPGLVPVVVSEGLTHLAASHFMSVWGWHIGLYLGGLIGTVHAILLIRRSTYSS